jgi:hypothetical protein
MRGRHRKSSAGALKIHENFYFRVLSDFKGLRRNQNLRGAMRRQFRTALEEPERGRTRARTGRARPIGIAEGGPEGRFSASETLGLCGPGRSSPWRLGRRRSSPSLRPTRLAVIRLLSVGQGRGRSQEIFLLKRIHGSWGRRNAVDQNGLGAGRRGASSLAPQADRDANPLGRAARAGRARQSHAASGGRVAPRRAAKIDPRARPWPVGLQDPLVIAAAVVGRGDHQRVL